FDRFPEMREFLRDEIKQTWLRAAECTGLTPAEYGAATGRYHAETPTGENVPAPILGAMLLKVLREEFPAAIQTGRPYSFAMLDYFWSKALLLAPCLKPPLRRDLEHRRPSGRLYQAAGSHWGSESVFTLTGRLRAQATYCARH